MRTGLGGFWSGGFLSRGLWPTAEKNLNKAWDLVKFSESEEYAQESRGEKDTNFMVTTKQKDD